MDNWFSYKTSFKNYCICVLVPLLVLLIAKLNPSHLSYAITTWHLLGYAVLGVVADIIYQYKRYKYLSDAAGFKSKLSKAQNSGLSFILATPLLFAIFITLTFYSVLSA